MTTTKFLILSLVTLTTLGSGRVQAEDPADRRSDTRPAVTHRGLPRLGALDRASKLVGTEITDNSGEKLGKIRDLAVELPSGRVLQVIVTSGGILGVGGRTVGIPPSMLMSGAPEKLVASRVTREKFQAAPVFELDRWSEATDRDHTLTVYRHFSVDPSVLDPSWSPERSSSANQTSADSTPWHPVRFSKLSGLEVLNSANEKIGKVDDLVVDLTSSRVNTVVVSSGGFLGIGDALNGIPPSLFKYDADNNQLTVALTKEALLAAPHFKSDEWSRYSTAESAHSVYRAYSVGPYFDTNSAPDNSARNIRDRDGRTLTPLDQGDSEADVRMTTAIRQAIIRAEGLPVNSRNVKVITRDGNVTLRGPVNTESEKARIEDIARGFAGANRVDSQLEVARDLPDNLR